MLERSVLLRTAMRTPELEMLAYLASMFRWYVNM